MSRPDPDFAALPAALRDADGPIFREPWQAQAFALAVKLSEAGVFTWREWTDALAGEIAAAGPADRGERYYEHWLAALEKLVDAKGLTFAAERQARRDAWEEAARATPHGEPIVLSRLSDSEAGR
ncbi:MAG TPA: nitrile hydratase accessory protein [Aestuariivirgaceae bacterium]|nr:nitrile hydratase accessory protein [Aestuariivirgaceae bacterium]